MPRQRLPRGRKRMTRKTIEVFLPMSQMRAKEWLKEKVIPFTRMRDHFHGVVFRIRMGYLADFMHEKDKIAPRYNPGFTAKEEKQYAAIQKSGARRYGSRAREVAARTVLSLRGAKRRRRTRTANPYRHAGKSYETTLSTVHVKFFQGYVEDVRYTRAEDGKPYSHVVETDAAELYLCEHATYGKCLLIVDPSGKTPLWG